MFIFIEKFDKIITSASFYLCVKKITILKGVYIHD